MLRIGVVAAAMEGAMWLRNNSDFGHHDHGWYTAALVFALALVAAVTLTSREVRRLAEDDGAGAAATRPMVILPLPLR